MMEFSGDRLLGGHSLVGSFWVFFQAALLYFQQLPGFVWQKRDLQQVPLRGSEAGAGGFAGNFCVRIRILPFAETGFEERIRSPGGAGNGNWWRFDYQG